MPTADQLKKIHGEDVELAPDDSVDEHLTEKQALAQAKAQGIEFIDTFQIKKDIFSTESVSEHPTLAEAKKALSKLRSGHHVVQVRTQAPTVNQGE